jgi:hypothetical protein
MPLLRSILVVTVLAGAATGFAAPVAGWAILDSSTGGPTGKTLAGADTSSPTIGNGADGSATQLVLFADIAGAHDTASDVSLANGQTVTLTGSATIVGNTSTMEQFRFGLFYEGSGTVDANGWLGYIANNSAGGSGGALRAKNAAYSGFHSQLFAATSASGSAVNLQTARDGGSFSPGTYDFSMSATRAGNAVVIDAALTRGAQFAQQWQNVVTTDPNLMTFDFNRVGFLSANMSADQVSFSNIAVEKIVRPTLTLEVLNSGPHAGAARLVNYSGLEVDFDYYEITSSAGSLDTVGWSSLDDQSSVAPPAGWHEAGGADELLLSEANILGSTALAAGSALYLGRAVTPNAAEDLQLSVGLAAGGLVAGIVDYVAPGDFNHDGAISSADMIQWRSSFGASPLADADFDGDSDGADFLTWQRQVTPSASIVAVPEPSHYALCVLGYGFAWCARRRVPRVVSAG